MDPNDSRIPDYAAAPGTASPDGFYNGRILKNREFAP